MKKIAGFFVLFSLCCAVFGQTESDFEYEKVAPSGAQGTSPRVTITNYSGRATTVAIPSTLGGVRVSRIGNNAFKSKGLISVDISPVVTDIGQEAFAGNQLEIITIGQGVNLGARSFENNFVTYYNNKGKTGGIFRYNKTLRVWQTEEEARLAAEAEARRRAAEQAKPVPPPPPRPAPPPPPPPSYSDYSDFDIGVHLLMGAVLNAGYNDLLSFGLNIQGGVRLRMDEVTLDLLGQVEGALMILFLPCWGAGVIGELHFSDSFGLGFGTGIANGMGALITESDGHMENRQYMRGAMIFFPDSFDEVSKVTIYGDYFLNSNWRFGVAFHVNYDDL